MLRHDTTKVSSKLLQLLLPLLLFGLNRVDDGLPLGVVALVRLRQLLLHLLVDAGQPLLELFIVEEFQLKNGGIG